MMEYQVEEALNRAKHIESCVSQNGGFYNTADEVHIASIAKKLVQVENELKKEKEDFESINKTHDNLLREYDIQLKRAVSAEAHAKRLDEDLNKTCLALSDCENKLSVYLKEPSNE
jgi:hypothetical protein